MMGMALFFRYLRLFPTLLAMVSSDSKSTHASRMAVCNSLDDNLLRLSQVPVWHLFWYLFWYLSGL